MNKLVVKIVGIYDIEIRNGKIIKQLPMFVFILKFRYGLWIMDYEVALRKQYF